jgi:hypothetical protein
MGWEQTMRDRFTPLQLWRPILFFVVFCLIGGFLGICVNQRIEELERNSDAPTQMDRG